MNESAFENPLPEIPEKRLVKDMELQGLSEYLDSSNKVYERNEIPFEDLYMNPEGELVLEMEMTENHQSHEGIVHGGITSLLLDSVVGTSGSIEASKLGKIALTGDLRVRFRVPVKVGGHVRVIGKVEQIDGNTLNCSGMLLQKEGEREIRKAVANMIMKMV